jgi:myotubularin-related protein 1/2
LAVEGADAEDDSLDDRYLDFGLRVEETGWLHHVRRVLVAGALVADKLLNDESSVLVHCSDGWDRTAQVCSIAQIILDPFFRTVEGFATLVEKDWLGFGHKFHDRLGHGVAHDESKEVSPVFLQFLDLCSQLLLQFPSAFEFTEGLLVFIADALYSNLFGDFIGNSERERREELEVDQNTKSVWRYITSPQHRGRFLNHNYAYENAAIFPNVRKVRLWERYYCRFDQSMKPTNAEEWAEDWGDFEQRSNSTTSTNNSVKTA